MNKKLLKTTIILFVIAVVYTLLVKFVGVDSVGPNNSEIGFAWFNTWFHNLFGTSNLWYKITKYLGLVPFLICAYYGFIGIKQLIKKKKISKVDKRLIYLGAFYILMLVVYVFFEKVIINYRPVILDGELEASYPSSHTMLAICICMSSLLISKYYVKDKYRKIFDNITFVLMILLVVGRIISGVHWITDIIGGILISLFLVSLYNTFIYENKKKKSIKA